VKIVLRPSSVKTTSSGTYHSLDINPASYKGYGRVLGDIVEAMQ